jgi:phosphoserine phosphatase RsbU/P
MLIANDPDKFDYDPELNSQISMQARKTATENLLLQPGLPVLPGVEVAVSSKAAHWCGGDYYNVSELWDGRLGFFIADVSGSGPFTTALVAVTATIVQRAKAKWRKPESLLQDLNQHFCSIRLLDGGFITAFCGVLDPRSGRFIYSSAGHPHPRLLRSKGNFVVPLDEASTLPLGIEHNNVYVQREVTLYEDDVLLLYTDGITEARSDNHEFFEIDRLDEVLRHLPQPSSASNAMKRVSDAVADFSWPTKLCDDQTLVAATFRSDTVWSGSAA